MERNGKKYAVDVGETFDSRTYTAWWLRKDGDKELVAKVFVARKGFEHDELALSLVAEASGAA